MLRHTFFAPGSRPGPMSRRHANLLLIDASLLWGFGNVAQKTELVHLDPFSAVGLRCLIGGILVLPLV